jgi:hypothetical protein
VRVYSAFLTRPKYNPVCVCPTLPSDLPPRLLRTLSPFYLAGVLTKKWLARPPTTSNPTLLTIHNILLVGHKKGKVSVNDGKLYCFTPTVLTINSLLFFKVARCRPSRIRMALAPVIAAAPLSSWMLPSNVQAIVCQVWTIRIRKRLSPRLQSSTGRKNQSSLGAHWTALFPCRPAWRTIFG